MKRIVFNISRNEDQLNRAEMAKWAKQVNAAMSEDNIGNTVTSITAGNYSRIYNSESADSQAKAAALIEILKAAPQGLDITGWQVDELDYATNGNKAKKEGQFSNAYWVADTLKI